MNYSQGDIIRIEGYSKQQLFVIVSKNAYINSTGTFHVCPILANAPEGPTHIAAYTRKEFVGVAICEQLKLIDPAIRNFGIKDRLTYEAIMNISDTIQGIFEYD